MSNRQLRLMDPQEIAGIVNAHDIAAGKADGAEALLEERKAFGEEVAETLNYKGVLESVKAETIERPADVALLKTLCELGIRPFDRDSVFSYMDDQIKNRRNMLIKAFGIPAAVIGGFFTAILAIAAIFKIEGVDAMLSLMGGGAPLALLGPGLLGVGIFFIWAEHTVFVRHVWERSNIEFVSHKLNKKGQHMLPREALEIALRIKKELPEARFQVHMLEESRGFFFALADDPFLEVRLGGESYFVAAWDEPGFDGRLMQVD
jgi:hypothetical protein